jgi:hypothetical protein
MVQNYHVRKVRADSVEFEKDGQSGAETGLSVGLLSKRVCRDGIKSRILPC